MPEEDKRPFRIVFKGEFDMCLDRIAAFFSEQGLEPLQWWYDKEIEIIDHTRGAKFVFSAVRGTRKNSTNTCILQPLALYST